MKTVINGIDPKNLKIKAKIKNCGKQERDKKTGMLDGIWLVTNFDSRSERVELSNGCVSISKEFHEIELTAVVVE